VLVQRSVVRRSRHEPWDSAFCRGVSASRPSDDGVINADSPVFSGRTDLPDRSMYRTYPSSAASTMSRSLPGT
jgi:hypothetical protein